MNTNKRKVFKVIQYILLLGGIVAGTLLVRYFVLPKSKADTALVRLTSVNTTYNRNTEYIATVFVDTRGQSMTAAQVELQWDTNFLDVTEITNANYLPVTLIPGAISGNKATITLGAQVTTSGAQPKNGTGVLANIKFRTKSVSGTTQISFTSNTQIAAVGSSVNVLGTMEALSVNVVGATPTPGGPTPTPGVATPTPTPTRSPSPTPTRSPSPTPGQVTATPVATASPTPKGQTPGPTVAPTATSTGTLRPADVNADGLINIIDIGIIIDNYGRTTGLTTPRADVNGDGIVNIIDIGIAIDNYGN